MSTLQLFFTRAKIFAYTTPGGEHKRFVATVSAKRPTAVPDWVRQTRTYQDGIKDESITDLTPPKAAAAAPAPVKKPEPAPAAKAPEPEPANEEEPEQPVLKNVLPSMTPKGISAQPTATGGRGRGKPQP